MKYPKRSQYKYAKSRYRIGNWPEYEAGLRRRGDLTVWLSEDAIDSWREWYKQSGYSKRSMVENTVYRYKTIIGRSVRSRTFAGQRVEVQLASKILNTMTCLGMPDSCRVA